jgi:hypothetical protein
MRTLHPNENLLRGQWVPMDGNVVEDDTSKRIQYLISFQLRELGKDASGWDALYLDPRDGRLWEFTYPENTLHGGGAPQLRCVTTEEARRKYGEIVPL